MHSYFEFLFSLNIQNSIWNIAVCSVVRVYLSFVDIGSVPPFITVTVVGVLAYVYIGISML